MDNNLDYERVKFIFTEDDYELNIELSKDSLGELEYVAENYGVLAMIHFLGENKENYVLLNEADIHEQALTRIIDCKENFLSDTLSMIDTEQIKDKIYQYYQYEAS